MVNEPSVFEPPKFYCRNTTYFSRKANVLAFLKKIDLSEMVHLKGQQRFHFCPPSQQESTLKGKNLLLGEIYSLLELAL